MKAVPAGIIKMTDDGRGKSWRGYADGGVHGVVVGGVLSGFQ